MGSMGLNIEARMREITTDLGGIDALREQMKASGYTEWATANFYPVVAWFPQYMDEPDILGIAVRDGFSFRILYGCLNTPHDRVNEWYDYVSLHDTYQSITEALLDHHKALIATEGDIKDAENTSWNEVVEEVIEGLRPTKFDVNDDDFLMLDTASFVLPLDGGFNDHLANLLNALRDYGFERELSRKVFSQKRHREESIEMNNTVEGFTDEFKEDWA